MKTNKQNIWSIGVIIFSILFPQITNGQAEESKEPVKVTYRKAYVWSTPHYNLPSCEQFRLYKETTFADGRTQTEVAIGPNIIVSRGAGASDDYGGGYYIGNTDIHGTTIKYNQELSDQDDSYGRESCVYGNIFSVSYRSIGVPDLSRIEVREKYHDDGWSEMGNHYKYSRLDGLYFSPENPQDGWYINGQWTQYDADLVYKTDNDYDRTALLRTYFAGFHHNGTILYVDNQLFEFSEFRPTYDVDIRIKDATMPNGAPAKIIIYEARKKYMDNDTYIAVVDTVYQLSPEEAKHWKPVPQTISLQIGNKERNADKQRPEAVIWEQENAIWQKVEDD